MPLFRGIFTDQAFKIGTEKNENIKHNRRNQSEYMKFPKYEGFYKLIKLESERYTEIRAK